MIREATPSDVPALVHLAARHRAEHASAQPQFWREAPDASRHHRPLLAQQVEDPDVRCLVCVPEGCHDVDGFLVATVTAAPPVYDPGGPTAVVDDFAVAHHSLWPTVGRALLAEASARLRLAGAVQLVVVCGDHDAAKLDLLHEAGLTTASRWLVTPLT